MIKKIRHFDILLLCQLVQSYTNRNISVTIGNVKVLGNGWTLSNIYSVTTIIL